jgi:hypothetical protein
MFRRAFFAGQVHNVLPAVFGPARTFWSRGSRLMQRTALGKTWADLIDYVFLNG